MNKQLIEEYLTVVKTNIANYKYDGWRVPGERYLQRDTLKAILELNERLKKIESFLGVFKSFKE